jgi:lysophospholipase L1-like esterase
MPFIPYDHSAISQGSGVVVPDGTMCRVAGGEPAWTLVSVDPAVGDVDGGDVLVITGTGFYGAPDVRIGGTSCTSVVILNTTTITCVSPAKAAGTYDLSVTIGFTTHTLTGGYVAWDPTAAANLRAWYRADSVALSGSSVVSMTDKTGNGYVIEHDDGHPPNQPGYLAFDFDHNGQPGVRYRSDNQQSLIARTAADWKFLHDFTGCTIFMRVQSLNTTGDTHAFLDNIAGTSANAGIGWYYNAGTQILTISVTNGLGGVIATASVPLSSYESATIVARYYAGGAFDIYKNGALVTSGTESGTISSADPAYPIGVGGYGSHAAGAQGDTKVPELGFYTRPISNAERALLESYLSARYDVVEYGTDTAPSEGTALTGTVEMLCTGNSITQGDTGATAPFKGGFRRRISTLFDGYTNFTLTAVGPSNFGGFGGIGDAHNGQSGWTIRGNTPGTPTFGHAEGSTPDHAGEIDDVLPTYTPDIHVIMLGTNNIAGTSEADRANNDNGIDWYSFVADCHARHPSRFVLCAITKNNVNGQITSATVAFNKAIRAAINKLRLAGITIQFVDTYAAIDVADLADSLHPNDSGYTKLGDVIAPAIRRAAGYT